MFCIYSLLDDIDVPLNLLTFLQMYLVLLVAKHVYDCTLLQEIEWGGMESCEFMKLSDPFLSLILQQVKELLKCLTCNLHFL